MFKNWIFGILVGLFAHGELYANRRHSRPNVADLRIVIEGWRELKVHFESPAEVVLGFKHKPKTRDEKSRQEKVFDVFRNRISKLLFFDEGLKCSWKVSSLDIVVDRGSDRRFIEADWVVSCEKPFAGSLLTIDFSEAFKNMKELRGEISGDGRKDPLFFSKGKGSISL